MIGKTIEGISTSLKLTNKLSMRFSYNTGRVVFLVTFYISTFSIDNHSMKLCNILRLFFFRERIFPKKHLYEKEKWDKRRQNDLQKHELYNSLFAKLLSCCMCV